MHIVFTEKEMEYIQKTDFNWSVKKDCPNEIRNDIMRKFGKLERQSELNYVKGA